MKKRFIKINSNYNQEKKSGKMILKKIYTKTISNLKKKKIRT